MDVKWWNFIEMMGRGNKLETNIDKKYAEMQALLQKKIPGHTRNYI